MKSWDLHHSTHQTSWKFKGAHPLPMPLHPEIRPSFLQVPSNFPWKRLQLDHTPCYSNWTVHGTGVYILVYILLTCHLVSVPSILTWRFLKQTHTDTQNSSIYRPLGWTQPTTTVRNPQRLQQFHVVGKDPVLSFSRRRRRSFFDVFGASQSQTFRSILGTPVGKQLATMVGKSPRPGLVHLTH